MENDNSLFSKIFMWMFIGLAITFGVGYYISSDLNLILKIFQNSTYLIIAIAEVVIAIILGARINKMSPMTAKILFIAYAALTGLTFSSIFIVYEISSIIYVFAISAIIFLVFGLLGYFTKIDLTKISTILFMLLLGIIILSFANIFIGSETLDLGLCIIGLVVFLVYIAYDIQKIKRKLYNISNQENLAIYGALELYLDFINIFIRLLQLFGKNDN
jgi:hypothetical protein